MIENDDATDTTTIIKRFCETARLLYEQDDVHYLGDSELAKFLVSSDFHQGKALAALVETLTWRKSYGTNTILNEDFTEHEKSGKLIFCGKAVDTSKGLVFIADRLQPLQTAKDIEQNIRYIIYALEKGRKNESFTDKITAIVDISNRKIGKQELKLVSILVPLLQKHYPETLSRLYLFPTNTIFYMSYQMSSYLIAKETIPKIKLCPSPASLAEFFHRDQYFKQFGGLALDSFQLIEDGTADLNEPPKNDKLALAKTKKVVKTVPLNLIEEIFVAPLEYHNI